MQEMQTRATEYVSRSNGVYISNIYLPSCAIEFCFDAERSLACMAISKDTGTLVLSASHKNPRETKILLIVD
jgi:hypothetical protein